LVIVVLAGGSDINKYLPGPHHDPPSKEKLKAMMDVITGFPFLPPFKFCCFRYGQSSIVFFHLFLELEAKCSWFMCLINYKVVDLLWKAGSNYFSLLEIPVTSAATGSS
jgi:hypothetical protein